MATTSKKSRRFSSIQVLALGCLILLVAFAAVSYLNYSAITSANDNLKSLDSNYQNLNSQYQSLQSDYNNLQTNYSNLQLNLSQVQANYLSSQTNFNALQTQLANLKVLLNVSDAQHTNFQTQFSSLQTDYTNFLINYQTLGTASPFSYLIFTDENGTCHAENGTTKTLDYSGVSAGQIAQTCIDELSASGGKIVFAGKVSLDRPLIVQNERTAGLLELSGLGPSTQLIAGSGMDCIDIIGGQPFGYGGPYHIVISDLVLTSETSPQGNYMNTGIHIKNWFGVEIEHVMVFYAQNSGIFIEDSANVHLNNVYVEGCYGTEYGGTNPLNGVGFWLRGSKDCYFNQCFSDTNQIGFLFDSNPQTNNLPQNVFLTLSEATLSQQQGVCIANVRGMVVSSSLVEGSNSDGIMIVDSTRVNIIDSLINGNAGNGFVVTSQNASLCQSQVTLKNCLIDSNNKNGVGIWTKNGNQISQINIEGCTITNSGAAARQMPNQIDLWDGVNISNDLATGGNCTYITVTNCFLGNTAGSFATQKFGVRSLQNSDYVQVTNNDLFTNLSGTYSLAGAHNTVKDNRDQ